ncbi:MAG: ATP-binding protein [Rivularia sp. (in: cyanobacteria)]
MAIFTKTTAIWRSLPVRHRGAIIIALPFSCLIVTLTVLVLSRQNTIKTYEKIDYTRTIILDSNSLLKILLDAETGTRGYVISRDSTFLERYNQALVNLPTIINRLDKTILDEDQKKEFEQIQVLANRNINILKQRIQEVERKKQVDIQSPQADILLLRNKNVMDDIRDAIAVFQEDELRKLGLHRQNLNSTRKNNNIVLLMAVGVSICSYVGAIYLFSKLDWQLEGQQLQLKEKKSLLEGIMGNVVDGIITLDKRDRIDSFNRAAATMFGCQSPEVIGKNIDLLISQSKDAEESQLNTNISAMHQGLAISALGIRKVGANFPIEISISDLHDGNGKMVIVRDITEQTQARQKLEANLQELSRLSLLLANTNQALTERNQELDSFAYIASHDLKAPLRGIINLSQWLEEDIQNDLSPENQRQFELLRQRIYRMQALIDGLLEYSRVGRMQTPSEKVDVSKLLAEIIDSLNPPSTFKIEIAEQMPVFMTKKLLLRQVFANLLSNAIKHHPRNDGHIKILVEDKQELYKFIVSDDGAGIDPKNRDKIFTIFQTLKSRDKKENTGVGLSIVKKIVESEGGEINLDSELGKGATFDFTWLKLSIEQ